MFPKLISSVPPLENKTYNGF